MLVDLESEQFASALTKAGEEIGLADYYRSCVRPLFRMPTTQWPSCCGGGCDPCAQQLVALADRICELLNVQREALP